MVNKSEAIAVTEDRPHFKLTAWQRRAVAAGVMAGVFNTALEATVIGTAMPTVVASLGGLNHYSWVFSAYLLTSTVTAPIWGKLSDIYGRRLFYQIGVALFLAGSILSGMCTSMPQLIAFRAVQGLGAGALVPLGMTIIGDIYTPSERARVQGLFSGVWGLASVVGPLMGGIITDRLSWRWVFYINIPFGLAAAAIMSLALKEPQRTGRPAIDYAGASVLMTATTMLMLMLVEKGGSVAALNRPRNLLLLSGATVLLVVFVCIERRTSDPIVPFELFGNRVVTVSVLAGFLAGMGMYGAISLVPLFAQGVMAASAIEAGSLLIPFLLSWVMLSIISGRLLLKLGYRPPIIGGFVLLTASFAIFTTFGRRTPQSWLVADLIMMGAGFGLTMPTLITAVQQAVPRKQLGVATSLNQFARSIGGAIGVALMGALLTGGLTTNLKDVTRWNEGHALASEHATELIANPNALIGTAMRHTLPADILDVLESSLAAALRNVFKLGTVIAGLALIVALWLPRGCGVGRDESLPREMHG